jgi:hypothetical protein
MNSFGRTEEDDGLALVLPGFELLPSDYDAGMSAITPLNLRCYQNTCICCMLEGSAENCEGHKEWDKIGLAYRLAPLFVPCHNTLNIIFKKFSSHLTENTAPPL